MEGKLKLQEMLDSINDKMTKMQETYTTMLTDNVKQEETIKALRNRIQQLSTEHQDTTVSKRKSQIMFQEIQNKENKSAHIIETLNKEIVCMR